MKAELTRAAAQGGSALMDALLALGIASLLMAAALPTITAGQDEIAARATADDLSSFQQLVVLHFMANRSAYEAAMADGTGATALCRYRVNPADGSGGTLANSVNRHTCAIDGSMLMFLKAMPVDSRLNNRYGERWIAIFRQIYDTQTPARATGAVDMLLVSAHPDPDAASPVAPDEHRQREVTSAAALHGGSGGYVPDADRAICVASREQSRYEACGNGWKVNLADFVDEAQVAAFGRRLAR